VLQIRTLRQPEEMSLMVSWDIPSKFTKMSKQVSIWLGSINLLPDSFVSTKIEMSIPESVLKMSSPDAPALVVCNVLTTHCLKLVKAKMRGTDQGPNGNAVPLHSWKKLRSSCLAWRTCSRQSQGYRLGTSLEHISMISCDQRGFQHQLSDGVPFRWSWIVWWCE
jgi:hypothetical protein